MTASDGTQANGGGAGPSRMLGPGVYVPTVALFTADDAIDEEATTAHAQRLAAAGVAGLVTHGSNGEAVHLDRGERQAVTRATRAALDGAGKAHLPLVVGCSAQSTRETVQLCREAADAGGSHALVLPPSYYGALLTDLVAQHYRAVADASPLPVVIYNFPPACGGRDLSCDTIVALAAHANIVGVKLTCGNTGKLARVVAATRATRFRAFGGSADMTVQTLAVGGHGVMAGLANLAPRACDAVVRLWTAGRAAEAVELQAVVARADWAAIQGGFVAVKAALQRYHGYGGPPRRPCALPEGKALEAQVAAFAELAALEASMADAA